MNFSLLFFEKSTKIRLIFLSFFLASSFQHQQWSPLIFRIRKSFFSAHFSRKFSFRRGNRKRFFFFEHDVGGAFRMFKRILCERKFNDSSRKTLSYNKKIKFNWFTSLENRITWICENWAKGEINLSIFGFTFISIRTILK